MQILKEAHSYKTYLNAAKKVESAIEELEYTDIHWFIIAQGDGRFTPCVKLSGKNVQLMHYFIDRKISVIA